ncbi:MAG: flagellar protein FlbD [Bdellovibrionales bacterium RIFOXYD1_FULL_55_31]|nr:MAG: flagellar protein FlbD [Bdellovibrionales bacterium RIFOXYD1_FULL_55_31]HLE01095.1 flagellar FlbD family protein [Bdellovibrionota bacterium]
MIRLSRLNGKDFVLNCDLIKFIEATPDTVITLTTGEKLMVRESVDQVIQETMHYRQRLYHEPLSQGSSKSE